MIKQIKSTDIKKFIKDNPKSVLLDVRTETNAGNFLKPNAKYVYLKFEIKSAIQENLNQTISTLRKIKSKQEFNSQNIDIHNFKRIFEFNSTYKNTRNIDRNAVVNNFIDILETVAVRLKFTFPTEISNVALYFIESTEFSQESRWILPKK